MSDTNKTKAFGEYTDTCAGEANYAWVRKAEIDAEGLSNLQVVARLRKALGLNGARGRASWNGDLYTFRPHNEATVMHVFFDR